MILRTPEYYKSFKCIAGVCPDSCCAGWEVDADTASLEYYKSLCGDIREKIDSVLDKDEFNNTIFRLTPEKRCPFLNDDNLCDMHIAIGAEHTPYTCRTFPRFINDFGGTREMGISFSCPVAADIIFNQNKPLSFNDEQNDLPPVLNEIDAQTYYYLSKKRKKAFDIIQNNDIEASRAIAELLDFATEVQNNLDEYKEGGDDMDFFDVFKNPELINPLWNEKVENAKINPVENKRCYRNIACYFIYRYFLTAVYDLDVLSKVKMAAIGVLIAAYMGADSRTMQLWSKETEHSQRNMDRYKKLLVTANCLTCDNLKKRFAEN